MNGSDEKARAGSVSNEKQEDQRKIKDDDDALLNDEMLRWFAYTREGIRPKRNAAGIMLLQHGTAFLSKTSLYGAESQIDSTSHTHTVGRKVSDTSWADCISKRKLS